MKTIRIKTTGMHCKSCAVLIEESFEDVEGIKSIKFDGNIVEIEFDPSNINEEKIKETIKKEGFGVD